MNQFYFRLAGPRPGFAKTMTEDEMTLMREHGAYWRDLVAKDVAIVFGLVSHPDDPFGICVVRADTLEAARKIADEDPVIRSGLGFGFEVYPMRAVVKER